MLENNRAYCLQIFGSLETDSGDIFRELRVPIPPKIGSFIKQAKKLRLAFDVTLSLTNSERVYSHLNDALIAHMNHSGLSFSSTSTSTSTSPTRFSSPSTPSSSYVVPLWSFLMSEKASRVPHKGAILKMHKDPTVSLMQSQLNKYSERWPKIPSTHDQQSQRKLIFIGVFIISQLLYSCLIPCDLLQCPHKESLSVLCINITFHKDYTLVWHANYGTDILLQTFKRNPNFQLVILVRNPSNRSVLLDLLYYVFNCSMISGRIRFIIILNTTPCKHSMTLTKINPLIFPSSSALPTIVPQSSTSIPSIITRSRSHSFNLSSIDPFLMESSQNNALPTNHSSLARNAPSSLDTTNALYQWQRIIEEFISEPAEVNQLQITAYSPSTGAQALLISLRSLICGTPPDPLPSGALVRNCELQNLSSRCYQFRMYVFLLSTLAINVTYLCSAEAVGSGPGRSVWEALIQILIAKHDHWTLVADGFFVPVITAVPPTSSTIADYVTYGSILKLTLLLQYDILPVSPFLILFLLHGFDLATNSSFICHLAPESHRALSTWPPISLTDNQGHTTLNLTLGNDPMNLIFNHIPGAQVLSSWDLPNPSFTPHPQIAHLSTLSPEGVTSIAAQLTSGVIFNSQHFLREPQHPLLIALKDGFDHPLGFAASHSRFSQVLIFSLYYQ